MADRVAIDDLAEAITDAVGDYTADVSDALEDLVERTAKDALSELKTRSPKDTGSYRKGWRVKKSGQGRGYIKRTIHNATDYQLTHLLEKGHAKRNGGRTAAIPHIAPVAESHVKSFAQSAGRIVERGG